MGSRGHSRAAGRWTRCDSVLRQARCAGIAATALASLLLVASPALAVDVPTRADVQRTLSGLWMGALPASPR